MPTTGIAEEKPMEASLEHTVVPKITWRLIPLLFLCYIIAYIDRINVGFGGRSRDPVRGFDFQVALVNEKKSDGLEDGRSCLKRTPAPHQRPVF